jgi:hypothetical protein
MQIEDLGEDLLSVTLVRDGTSRHMRGNFIGLYGIPSRGGRYWYAENGDNGYCETDEEARAEIMAARRV